MKTIITTGGLGNQMFIYAFYYSLKRNKIKCRLNISLYNYTQMHNGFELNRVFGINDTVINKIGTHILWLRFILKTGCFLMKDRYRVEQKFDSYLFPYLYGYWQSDYYFLEYKQQILKTFSFKNISQENIKLASIMTSSNSVSLHIRRGDYLHLKQYLGICDEMYYMKAIKYINNYIESPHFYIFSNDPIWSTNFAKDLGIKYTIISHNIGINSYQDMFLMSKCKHNILANSSFSWWGAYLNQYSGAIKIAPKKWDNNDSVQFNKIRVPSDYIKI